MAERKARRKRAKGGNESELTKEEKAMKKQMETVAKYLRRAVKCKTATIKGQNIEFFTGSKAVDALMDSKWGGASRRSALGTNEPAFPSRESAISYCERLLECNFFIRGYRLEVEPKDKEKEKEKELEGNVKDREASPRAIKERRKKAKNTASAKEGDGEKKQSDAEKKDGDEKKKKKKFKIRPHEEQLFEDSNSEIFIWQYSPQGWFGTLVGFGLVLVAIAVTMYPLWPEWTRYGAYIVSLGLAGLIGLLLLSELVRIVLFAVIWLLTWGHVHFTLLPNLYEDVGILESFRPLYKLEYSGSSADGEDDEDDENDDKDVDSPDNNLSCSDEGTNIVIVEELAIEDGTSDDQTTKSCSDHDAAANKEEGSDSDHRQQSASDA